jgi:hypothetical protein
LKVTIKVRFAWKNNGNVKIDNLLNPEIIGDLHLISRKKRRRSNNSNNDNSFYSVKAKVLVFEFLFVLFCFFVVLGIVPRALSRLVK